MEDEPITEFQSFSPYYFKIALFIQLLNPVLPRKTPSCKTSLIDHKPAARQRAIQTVFYPLNSSHKITTLVKFFGRFFSSFEIICACWSVYSPVCRPFQLYLDLQPHSDIITLISGCQPLPFLLLCTRKKGRTRNWILPEYLLFILSISNCTAAFCKAEEQLV